MGTKGDIGSHRVLSQHRRGRKTNPAWRRDREGGGTGQFLYYYIISMNK
jgi:hypothetical protein